MNDTFTRQLYTEFPELYRGIGLSSQESAMCWGFECGDGWYPLLRELSERLVSYQRQQPDLNLQITQVKSKLGSLRIHSRGGDSTTQRLIANTSEQASRITEHP